MGVAMVAEPVGPMKDGRQLLANCQKDSTHRPPKQTLHSGESKKDQSEDIMPLGVSGEKENVRDSNNHEDRDERKASRDVGVDHEQDGTNVEEKDG
jgi:hypothetical protein